MTVDHQTITAYNEAAAEVAALHTTLVPERVYRLVDQFFIKGASCADVGCGIGRDTDWLSQQGYKVTGIDAAEGMLSQAQRRYPSYRFINDSLPLLASFPDESFNNVLCSAVIMHLAAQQIESAVFHLLRVMTPGGIILISLRGTHAADYRENSKLYTPIAPTELISAFTANGAPLLHAETDFEVGRGLTWHNLVFRKLPHPVA